MQQAIPIKSFTVESISQDSFIDSLPEYYQLKDVIELQDWHDNQTVFEHSLNSARALDKITNFDYLNKETSEGLSNHLSQTIDTNTRMDLLRIATLFHDIGKVISLQHNADGDTSSPSHGLLGSWVAQPLLDRFDISVAEKNFILNLISDHLLPSDLIEISINNKTNGQRVVNLLQKHRSETAIELLLLAYADWMGSNIRESVKDERNKRVVIVHDCLSALVRIQEKL